VSIFLPARSAGRFERGRFDPVESWAKPMESWAKPMESWAKPMMIQADVAKLVDALV
jgi:hypothetical protein